MELASTNGREKAAELESTTSELLRQMVVEKRLLEPDIGADGRIHYPFAEAALKDHGAPDQAAAVRAWISDMVSVGILRSVSSVEVLVCPTHLRADAMVQLECANCKGRSMRKSSLVEHIYCGFIADDGRFKKDEVLQCPKCQKTISSSGELRVSGIWYECSNCLSKASSPSLVFLCREAKHEFTAADAVFVPMNSYAVVERMAPDLKNTLVLDPSLAEMLKNLGYAVSYPASVKGQSGAVHTVDLLARKNGADIVLQVSVDSKPIEATAVMSFFSKTYDIKPKLAVLIAIPAASQSAKQICVGYGVSLIEDSDGNEAVQKVKALLEKDKRA